MGKAILFVLASVLTWTFLELLEHAATSGYPAVAITVGMAFAYAVGRLHAKEGKHG